MSIDIEKIPLIFIINGSHINEGEDVTVDSSSGNSDTRGTVTLDEGNYDIFLDNLTTLNASNAENINTMAFSTILNIGTSRDEVTKSKYIISKDLVENISNITAAQGNTIIVPNESKSPSDVCVCHKARKMNYVGTIKTEQPNPKLTFNFSIKFLHGGSIFKTDHTLEKAVIAEYILVKRK